MPASPGKLSSQVFAGLLTVGLLFQPESPQFESTAWGPSAWAGEPGSDDAALPPSSLSIAASHRELNSAANAFSVAMTKAEASITAGALKQSAGVLASDSLEGRQAGTRGGQAAAAYLVTELKKTRLQPAGTASWYQEFRGDCKNILARKPGSDPTLKDEVIVLGAHYDHVGYGNPNNSRGGVGQIHNGADDNASGTSLLLSVARAFDELPPLKRTVIFAFWDSEENGLLGSTHWLDSGLVPAARIRNSINTDMVGRLRKDLVKVQAWRSQAGLRQAMSLANQRANPETKLFLKFDDTVIADSDHWPFFSRRIPALQVDTELHDDYHRPTDDADRLNFEGIERISRWVFHLAVDLAERDTLAPFREDVFEEVKRGVRYVSPVAATPPRLGMTWQGIPGDRGEIIVEQVRKGSPADLAGIEPDDRILAFGPYGDLNTKLLKSLVVTAPREVPVELQKPNGTVRTTRVSLAGAPVRVGLATRTDPAMPGVVGVTDVIPNSPAAVAGVQPGDWIYRVAGEPVGTIQNWRQLADHMSQATELEIERNGRIRTMTIEPLLFE